MQPLRYLRILEKSFDKPLIVICTYEAIALTLPRNKYTPPISKIVNRHKWIIPIIVGAQVAHFYYYEVNG